MLFRSRQAGPRGGIRKFGRALRSTCSLAALAWFCGTINGEAAKPIPEGAAEFAGRIAHNHWSLFGPEKRPELEALNRELRGALQQAQRGGDASAREAGEDRARSAIERLQAEVQRCPALIRVDLTANPPVMTPSGAIELPGETGGLLFAVHAGGDDLRFSAASTDFAQLPGESSLVAIDVASRGTTYTVASLEHVPFGRTTMMLELRRPGVAPERLSVDLHVPAPGRLKLTVLSDDTGKPTPAMVRLMWRADGLQRQPANGIEFAPQFDRQGAATGARAAKDRKSVV